MVSRMLCPPRGPHSRYVSFWVSCSRGKPISSCDPLLFVIEQVQQSYYILTFKCYLILNSVRLLVLSDHYDVSVWCFGLILLRFYKIKNREWCILYSKIKIYLQIHIYMYVCLIKCLRNTSSRTINSFKIFLMQWNKTLFIGSKNY